MIDAEFEEIEDAGSANELDLADTESLPWLEADEDVESTGGGDTARIIGFALILLTVAAALLWGIWTVANRSGDASLVADGSVIEAPEGPVRERPEDPGGREFAGTGDVAPVVSEGGTPEGVMDTDGGADSSETSGESSSTPAASAGGVAVQLAAYSSRARAEQGWGEISGRTDALAGVRYRIEQGEVDIGTVYRLQAVAPDRAAADRLCAALRADGLDCTVKP